LTYTDFKETILKRHKELLNPGIEKTTKWFREKYYFPDYQKLIKNIINECEICNIVLRTINMDDSLSITQTECTKSSHPFT